MTSRTSYRTRMMRSSSLNLPSSTSTAYRNYRASLARGETLFFQAMRRKEPQTYFRRAVLVGTREMVVVINHTMLQTGYVLPLSCTRGFLGRRCTSVTPIRVVGVGDVTLEELEAMFLAYMNAGAPKPVLEGTLEEQAAILRHISTRGDAQMRALVESYLRE